MSGQTSVAQQIYQTKREERVVDEQRLLSRVQTACRLSHGGNKAQKRILQHEQNGLVNQKNLLLGSQITSNLSSIFNISQKHTKQKEGRGKMWAVELFLPSSSWKNAPVWRGWQHQREVGLSDEGPAGKPVQSPRPSKQQDFLNGFKENSSHGKQQWTSFCGSTKHKQLH